MTDLAIKNDSFIRSTHNNIQCLSFEKATRPRDRCWFTSKQIQDWAGMDRVTLNRKLEKLANVGRIVGLKDTTDNIIDIGIKSLGSNLNLVENSINSDIIEFNLPHQTGSKITKLYNLNVLNQLAMVEYENENLNTIANKFSDILSEVETTGQYNVQKQDPSYVIEDPIERAKAWIKEQEEKRALEAEKKALEDKTKELEDENEIIRGGYYNTKQIYDIIMQEYPEALKQAKTTNYNKLRKALKRLSNEDKESVKIYKKHVTNSQGNIEWRQEYYFVKKILLKVLDCISDNIKYIANVR